MESQLEEAQEKWLSDEATDALTFMRKVIEEYEEDVQNYRDKIMEQSNTAIYFWKYKNYHDDNDLPGEVVPEYSWYANDFDPGIRMTVYVNSSDDISEVVKGFRAVGLEQRKDPDKTYGNKSYRDYSLKMKYRLRPEGKSSPRFEVLVKVVGENCKVVEKGEVTKEVTETEYEVVCE